MEEILKYLHSIHPLTDELQDHLRQGMKVEFVKKEDYILSCGNICKRIYFIEKGLLRCFYLEHDKEVCSWFMKEGDLAISVRSFFQQLPSNENIQALEDCTLHYVTYDELQFIYHKFPQFNFNGRVLTEKYYALSEERLFSIRMHTALERYKYILNHSPELIKRIYTKHLASYLGITAEHLSTIKWFDS